MSVNTGGVLRGHLYVQKCMYKHTAKKKKKKTANTAFASICGAASKTTWPPQPAFLQRVHAWVVMLMGLILFAHFVLIAGTHQSQQSFQTPVLFTLASDTVQCIMGACLFVLRDISGWVFPVVKEDRDLFWYPKSIWQDPPLNYKSGITQWYLFYVFCFWHKYSSKSATSPFIRWRRANRYRRCSSRLVRFSIRWSI